MQYETLIALDLLDEVRTTLAAAYSYHDGLDITESQRKMWPEKRNSNLTIEIQSTLSKVEELVAQHVMRERDERRQRRMASQTQPSTGVDTHSVEIEFDGELDQPVMCEYDDHEIDEDGYCVYCGYDEDEIEREQGDGSSLEDAADSE